MRGVAHDPMLRAKLMALHEQGVSLTALSEQSGIARPVLSRWWARYRVGDWPALQPRSRRPQHSPTQLPCTVAAAIWALRQRRWGAGHIARELGLGHGTVQRLLEAHGCSRLDRPVRRVVRRYEKSRPGELVHLDLKYLPTLENGPEFEYAAVDDFTREAVATISVERSTAAATRFLEQLLVQLPYRVEAVMTDNDLVFTMRYAHYSARLTRFQQALRSYGIAHRLLRPHAPESNGKVERFLKTVDEECFAVVRPHRSIERAHALDAFLVYYNHERGHQSLGGLTPIERREAFFRQGRA
jgi:transposase InsO family protein